ncbi:MAG: hypothetical protein K2H85_11750, partial [Allobaculum sp.]|nr:hypothetical protein [Allobaculum sp.]
MYFPSSILLMATTAITSSSPVSLVPSLIFQEKDLSETENLDFSNQDLKTFDASAYLDMKTLDVSNNQLEILDLSSNPMLGELDCSNNQLKTLNLKQNLVLVSLDCSNNCLATLELDSIPFLSSDSCQVSNQKIVLPKNVTTLNLVTQFKVDPSRLDITKSPQEVVFNSSTMELSGIKPNTTITYTYTPFKNQPDLLMDVTLSFTGKEDPTLSKPEEPISNIDSLPAFTGGTQDDSTTNTNTTNGNGSGNVKEKGIAMHRLYNPNTGEHLYTS